MENSSKKTIKKLAIMGSGSGKIFEAILKIFKSREDIEISCFSDVEDSFILSTAKKAEVKNQYLPFEKNLEHFANNKYDLVVLAGYDRKIPANVLDLMGTVISIHPSLLPAFQNSENPIQDAFLHGVKVSGITIYWVDGDIGGGKIIAQYPVFITNETHFDEFESDIQNIANKLYPVVIEKILDDKVFDFQDLMKSSCNNGSCGSGGCGGKCGHK